MNTDVMALRWLDREARALGTRVTRVRPFAMTIPAIPSAAVSPGVLSAIETQLRAGRVALLRRIDAFLGWLTRSGAWDLARSHTRFALLRLRFQQLLARFDIFADALGQRSEHDTGVWVAGLDVVASDALRIEGFAPPPPVLCYLDRGHGGAIRRLHARLPGAVPNPVALIRLPRERMIGSGVASSLAHEVGHQVASSLGLEASLRPVLRSIARGAGHLAPAWLAWDRWLSEVLADFWGVARVGVTATQGLLALLSLPRAFMFHTAPDDPHPTPWIRAKLSCALGAELYPSSQWGALARMWEGLMPLRGLDPEVERPLRALEETLPAVATLLAEHRPAALRGLTLRQAARVDDRQPSSLRRVLRSWERAPGEAWRTSPTIALAALGQARTDGAMRAETESRLLEWMLRRWALETSLNTARNCSAHQ
ncbi:MAG: hypothetical protein HY909_28120 [Deltaproteobacteria bacterium]|nr:hypothetical protein [Deltaproteobacteria bacterium]